MDFDPLHNEKDKELLDGIIQSTIKRIADKSMSSGTIKINGHEYNFKGLNAWVEVYIKWYDRKKKELSDKVSGYSKADRWDGVGKIILAFQDKSKETQEKEWQLLLRDLFDTMIQPDKEIMEPDAVTSALDEIYKKIHSEVFTRLFEETVELKDVPAVWEGFIRHINAQQEAATNFYLISPEMSTTIYEAAQEVTKHDRA